MTWPALQIANASVGGAGKHIYDLTYQEAANFFYVRLLFSSPQNSRLLFSLASTATTDSWTPQIGSFSTWIFYVAVALIKISILLFYMRLSGFCSRNWNIAHWTMIVIMALFAATAFFLSIFACRPIYASFNIKKIGRTLGPENPPKCLDVADRVTAFSVIHVVSDFALLVVPVMMLKNVQVKTRVKLKVWSVGIIGCASCICSCFRAVVQYRLAATDVTWHYWDLYIWTITDLTTGACAASLPVLSVFVTRVIDQWNRLTGKEVKGSKTLTPTMKNKRAKEAIKTHNKFLKHVNRKAKKQGDTFEDSLELTGSSRAEEKALEGTTDVESGMLSPGGGGGGMASGLGGVGSPIGMASPAPQSRAGEGDLKGDGDERGVFTTRHRVESECLKSRDREDLEKGDVFGLKDAEREMRREEEEERRDGTKGVYTGHGSVGQAL